MWYFLELELRVRDSFDWWRTRRVIIVLSRAEKSSSLRNYKHRIYGTVMVSIFAHTHQSARVGATFTGVRPVFVTVRRYHRFIIYLFGRNQRNVVHMFASGHYCFSNSSTRPYKSCKLTRLDE